MLVSHEMVTHVGDFLDASLRWNDGKGGTWELGLSRSVAWIWFWTGMTRLNDIRS